MPEEGFFVMIQLHSHYEPTHSWRYFDKIVFTNLDSTSNAETACRPGSRVFFDSVAGVQTQRKWRTKLHGLKSNPEHRLRLRQ